MTPPPVVGFTGAKESGKTTAAGLLAAWGYQPANLSDVLDTMLGTLNPRVGVGERYTDVIDHLGVTDAKARHREVRRLMDDLGVALRDVLGPDALIGLLGRRWEGWGRPPMAIGGVRFAGEVEWVRAQGGAVVRIVRPGFDPDGSLYERPDDLEADVVIVNDDTLEALAARLAGALHLPDLSHPSAML